jgi:hypothetical protein
MAAKNPNRQINSKVRFAVHMAIKAGILTRQPCETCNTDGIQDTGFPKVSAHHDDYNQPLNVRWLCTVCHAIWHRSNNAIPLDAENRQLGTRELFNLGCRQIAVQVQGMA